VNILQTPTFKKQVKKLYKDQKKDLDTAILAITQDPSIGEMKKGDLQGIQVYKFKMVQQLTLLAYIFEADQLTIILLTMGTHENFYRNLKK